MPILKLITVTVIMLVVIHRSSAQVTPVDRELMRTADERIQKYRTSPTRFQVLDADGHPISGATVHVRQTRHSFLFGTGALTLLKHKSSDTEQRYQELLSGPFNYATLLTYWQDMEREQGKVDYSLIMSQANRLHRMGFIVKGHPMILAGAAPKWAPKDVTLTKDLTQKRITAMGRTLKGLIDVWDVVGDATTAHGAGTGLGEWARKEGPTELTGSAMHWARSANKDAVLLYNEYNLDSALEKLITEIKSVGKGPDVVGLEAHMGDDDWSMERFWQTTERFAKLGLPLHWSEITVLSGERPMKSRITTTAGEERQADYIERMYTLLFSHPAVTAIAWWNPVDGDWDNIPGGLIRSDLTPKPAYDRLMKLVKGKWWTDREVETGSNGEVVMNCFHGEYEATVRANGNVRVVKFKIQPGKTKTLYLTIPVE